MRYNRKIAKCIGLLLLVVFSQKMSSKLYYHILVHLQDKFTACSSPLDSQLSNTCNRMDDFYVPFLEPLQQDIITPPKIASGYTDFYTSSIFSPVKYFHSLRAPPIAA